MAQFTPQRAVYPLHTDNFQFMPDNRVLPGVIADGKERGNYPEAQMSGFEVVINANNALYRKRNCSYNDPICVFYVVDAMLKAQRGHYIRPRYLIPYLREEHKQYYWSEMSLGRIIAGIWGAVKDLYEPHAGGEERKLPFASGRDSKGRYYVIDPIGGDEGYLWLLGLRSNARKRAQMLMSAEREGVFDEAFSGAAKTGSEYILEFAPDPIRPVDGYRAQADGRRFSHVAYEERGSAPTFA